MAILSAMAGMNGFDWHFTANVGIPRLYSVVGVVVLIAISVSLPNTQQWMGAHSPALGVPKARFTPLMQNLLSVASWRPGLMWSVAAGMMAAACILSITSVSEFIYFQF